MKFSNLKNFTCIKMSKDTSELIPALNYGLNVTEITSNEFNTDGSLKTYNQGTALVVFGGPYCRFCLTMQKDFQRFADEVTEQKSLDNILQINISKYSDVLSTAANNKWKFGLKQFPSLVYCHNGQQVFHHDLDYTYSSFVQSLQEFKSEFNI